MFHHDTAWIPATTSTGAILTAFTADSPPAAHYAFTDNFNWISGTTGRTQRRWDDPAAPWPAPSNMCQLYGGACDPNGNVIPGTFRYTAAVRALSTDHESVAAIVAVMETLRGLRRQEVVVLTSIDGGRRFTNGRIITDRAVGATFIDPDRIDATTIVTTEAASERRQDSTAAHLVVWRGDSDGFEASVEQTWRMQKVQVDPSNGDVAILWDTVELEDFPDHTGTVTVRAWEDDEGLENIVLLSSERRDEQGEPYGTFDALPSCPSEERVIIEWYWRRAIGVFKHFGASAFDQPNYVEPKQLLDVDETWRPCVGPSHVTSTEESLSYYRNSDRMDMDVNRNPRLQRMTYGRTSEQADLNRVFTITRDLDTYGYPPLPLLPDFFTEELPAPEGAEDYTPRITMSQGVEVFGALPPLTLEHPQSSIVRRRVATNDPGAPVDIVARTTVWQIVRSQAACSGPGLCINQVVEDANVTIGGGTAPAAVEALELGLVHKPVCVNGDYGTCTLGFPDRLFHAAYPESALSRVSGQAYEH
ncbi:MAG: hypothetical protein AAF928_21625 [Myxococcota bacterium]